MRALGLAMMYEGKDTEESDGRTDQMLESFRKFMNVRAGKRQGWDRFCAGLGVDPEAITAPFVEHVADMENVLEGAYEAALQLTDDPDADERRIQGIADAEHRVLVEAWPNPS